MQYPPPPPDGTPYGPAFPPGAAYGPPPAGFGQLPPQVAFEAQRIDHDTRTWLIVGAVGWVVGLVWITGPLAWYHGGQARNRFRALGLPPSSIARNTWLFGIVSTVLSVVLFAAIVAVLMLSVLNIPVG